MKFSLRYLIACSVVVFLSTCVSAQSSNRIVNVTPVFVQKADTIRIDVKNLDTSSNSIQILLGGVPMNIIESSDSHFLAQVPSIGMNSVLHLRDTTANTVSLWPHIIRKKHFGTDSIFASKPSLMFDASAYVDIVTGPASPSLRSIGDLNGDGRPDFVCWRNGGSFVLINKITSDWTLEFDTLLIRQMHDIHFVDMDGNGCVELVGRVSSGVTSVYRMEQKKGKWQWRDSVSFKVGSDILLADINHDGKTDHFYEGAQAGSPTKYGLYYNLNRSNDTLKFDSLVFLDLDSVRLVQPIGPTDSGTYLLAGYHLAKSLNIIELYSDTAGLKMRTLSSQKMSFNAWPQSFYDFNNDGRNEIWSYANSSTWRLLHIDSLQAVQSGDRSYNTASIDLRYSLQSQDDSVSFQIARKTSTIYTTERLVYSSDTVSSQTIDTVNYNMREGSFVDVNGDGYTDLVCVRTGYVFPSVLFDFDAVNPSSKIHFLFDSVGHVIEDHSAFAINRGKADIEIDSMVLPKGLVAMNKDSSSISFPVTLQPGDSFFYSLRFTSSGLSESLSSLSFSINGIDFPGPMIHSKFNSNPSFSIVKVVPSTFTAGDSVRVVLENFRGLKDSTSVYFGTSNAEIISLQNDTILIIVPRVFINTSLLIFDGKNDLTVETSQKYSMYTYDGHEFDFNTNLFKEDKSLHPSADFSSIVSDLAQDDVFIRDQNSKGQENFYRSFLGTKPFKNVGSTGFARSLNKMALWPIDADSRIDQKTHSSKGLTFYRNSASDTAIFPFKMDTLFSIPMDHISTPNYMSYVDLDLDGTRDLIYHVNEYKNGRIVIRSRLFDSSSYQFSAYTELPIENVSEIVFHDLNRDGMQDIFVYTNRSFNYFENQSRPGHISFKRKATITPPRTNMWYNHSGHSALGDDGGILMLDSDGSDTMHLNRITAVADSIKIDTLHSEAGWGRLSSSTKSTFIDLNGNGKLDILCDNSFRMMNSSDSTGFRFDTAVITYGFGLKIPTDINGDGAIDFIGNSEIQFSRLYAADIRSEIEKDIHAATYPFIKEGIEEPAKLYTSDSTSYSKVSKVYLFNTGLAKIRLTDMTLPSNLQVSDSLHFSNINLPVTIDTGQSLTLFIRNDNTKKYGRFADTIFLTVNENIVLQQVVESWIYDPPRIDSIRPVRAHQGDTVTIYGYNLVNHLGEANVVRTKERIVQVLSFSDSVYQIIAPRKVGSGAITISDTVNLLGTSSAEKFELYRSGPGHTLHDSVFATDTIIIGNVVSQLDPSDFAFQNIELVDFNEDGQLDFVGINEHHYASVVGRTVQTNWDEDDDENEFDFTNKHYGGSGRARTGRHTDYFIDDVNHDGDIDILTIDVGDCVQSDVTCDGFSVVSQTFNATKNHAFYTYTQSYLYTGTGDARGGQYEVYGDFNKDGIPDLIHPSNDSFFVVTSFADHYTHTTTPSNKQTYVSKYKLDSIPRDSRSQGRILSLDVDGDGWEDIIDGGIVYRNVSDSGKFKFQIAYNMTDSFNICSVGTRRSWFFRGAPAYLNKDNKPDLFGTGLSFCTGTHSYVSLINKSVPGKIDFDFKSHLFGGHLLGELIVGDLNGDSMSDIVHFYQGDSILLLTNQTDTAVKFAVNKMALKDPTSAVIKDYDGDGDNDLIVTNFASSRYRINFYRNNALEASVSSNNVSFSIPENTVDSATVFLYSDGALDLKIDSIYVTSNNPNLIISPSNGLGPQVVKSGKSISLKLNYSGDSVGTILDTIRIRHNAPSREETILISATTLPWPQVKFTHDTLRFRAHRVGDTVVKTYTIQNIGKDTLDLLGSSTGNFSYNISGDRQKIAPKDSADINVSFMPDRKARLNARSTINHNGVSKTIQLRLEGEGISPVVTDSLTRNVASIKYSSIGVDSFYLKNTGNDTLNVRSIDTSKNLSLKQFDQKIAPADSGLIVYNYRVNAYGNYTENLVVHHDYYDDSTTGVSVKYSGLRGNMLPLKMVHFLPVQVDSLSAQTLHIENNGSDSLRIDSAIITKKGHWFDLDSNYTFPLLIAPSDTFFLKLKCEPLQTGLCFTDIAVYSNSIEGFQKTILHGASIVDFDSVRVGISSIKPIALINYSSDSIQTKKLTLSNSAFEIKGLEYGVARVDSLTGTAKFTCSKEFVTSSTGTYEWKWGSKQSLALKGFGIAPKVFQKKLVNLYPPKVGVLTRDTLFVKNEGTDTLFASNFTSTSLITIIDSFNQILAGDSGRIILDYLTNKRTPEQEYIYFNHNYYAFSSTEIELAYFGQSPGIFISKSTLDFGDKAIGPFYQDSVYIKNTGNFNLVISKVKMNGDTNLKAVTQFPISIAPNDRKFVVLNFDPEQRKAYSGALTLYHSAPGDSSILNVRGKGIGSEVDSCWVLETQKKSINANQSFDFYLKNTGDLRLNIDSVKLGSSAELSLVRTSKVIFEGDSGRFTANLSYQSLTPQYDTIYVFHDNYKYSSTKIVVSYKGTDAIGMLTPRLIDHGEVSFGQEGSREFVIKNIGDETLEINFAVYSKNQQFRLKASPNGSKILPGDSIKLESIYTPSSIGVDLDTLEFWTNSQTWKSENYIVLRGTLKAGKLVILDQPKIVGEVEYGDSIEGVIRLRNEGSDTLSINKLTTAHPDLELVLAGPSKLDTMDISTINFKFRARNKKDTSLLQYTVTNTGLAKKVDGSIELSTVWPELILPDSFHFSNTQINTKNIDTFWLYNTGTDTLSISQFAWDKSLYFSDSMNFPVLVLPNDSLELYLRFNPDKMGYHSDSLALSTNEYPASNPKVLVGGVAIKTGSIGRSERYKNIGLKQNVPNPGYGHTSIAYHVSEREHVQLSLLDNSGKLIKTMFEGEVNPGEHQLELDLNSIASGVYYYTLEVDGLILKKRMLVQH